MKFSIFISLASLVALFGCSPSLLTSEPIALNVVTPTYLSKTPSPIPTATNAPPIFQVENLNPRNRAVTLSQLNLKPTTQILVFDPKTEQTLAISDQATNPILNIQSGVNTLLDGIEMSPDHRWFAYLEIAETFSPLQNHCRRITNDG